MPSHPRPRPASLKAVRGVQGARVRTERELEQRRKAKAGSAVSEHDVFTVGVGNIAPSGVIAFVVPFLEQPQFGYGAAVVRAGGSAWHYPASTAMVVSWVVDEGGYYTGARMSYRVQVDPTGALPPADPAVEIQHMLTFSGEAYRPMSTGSDDVLPITADFG